jgi:hypothetical protein
MVSRHERFWKEVHCELVELVGVLNEVQAMVQAVHRFLSSDTTLFWEIPSSR